VGHGAATIPRSGGPVDRRLNLVAAPLNAMMLARPCAALAPGTLLLTAIPAADVLQPVSSWTAGLP